MITTTFRRIARIAMLAAGSLLLAGHSAAIVLEKPLFELGTPKAQLLLGGDRSTYVFKIPVSPRETVTGAQVVLNTVNSTALIKSRSAMTVRLNSTVLGQYPLDPIATRQRNVINLPAALLRPGYNDLAVSVIQHYTYDCEDPGSSELWTEIDAINSTITMGLEGLRTNLRPRLSQLNVAFDARAWLPPPIKVVTATDSFTPSHLKALSYVSQGVFMRRGRHVSDYSVEDAKASVAYTSQAGPFVGLNPELTKSQDVVLVGVKSELGRLLGTDIANNITGAYAGIFPSADGTHFILVLSGRDEAELMTATRAFASPEFVFIDAEQTVIAGDALPKFQPVTSGYDTQTTFATFKFQTTSVRGFRAPIIPFKFRAPGDFAPAKGKFVTLRMHFSYGAGLREGSALNIRVNGKFASAIALNDPTGAEFTKYEVALPSNVVRPGINVVEFEPVFVGVKNRCEMTRDENLFVTIFENSTIEVPRTGAPVIIPDLARFTYSLWPYADGAKVAVLDSSSGFVTHAMQVMGTLALRNEGPIDADFEFGIPTLGHTMVIGNYKDFEEGLRNGLPLPSRYDWKSRGAASAWMQSQINQRIVTAFMTPDYRAGIMASTRLLNDGYWNAMAGEAVVMETENDVFEVIPARNTTEVSRKVFEAGALTNWRTITFATVALALLLAFALLRLAANRAQNRLAKGDGAGN